MEAKTEHAEYLFRASEYSDGTAFISTELIRSPGLTVLSGASFLSFELYDNSLENVERFAKLLNEYVKNIGVTAFPEHPMFAQMRGRQGGQ
jgi:hypothetical protein